MRFRDLPLVSGSEPIFGHMRTIRRERLGFLNRLAREVERMSRLDTVGRAAVVVNHPEVLQELLVENARTFEKTEVTRFALYPLAGEGLFTSNGELWRRQRKLMAPLFHSAQLKGYAEDMVSCAARGLDAWVDGQELSLAKETTRITMSIAGKTLFDADTFTEADAIGDALTVALEWTAENSPSGLAVLHLMARMILTDLAKSAPLAPAARLRQVADRLQAPVYVPGEDGRRLRAAIATLDAQVQRMIDARRGAADKDDLLARLLRAKDDTGANMSDRQVRDEILTLFVAGHETTATGLAWAIYCLAKNPEVYAAVEREVDALGGAPTFADVERLPLTLRVFKEALRLYPPVPLFARQTQTPTTLDGCALRAGTVAMVCPWALHRRPELWPDPERFDPARFLPEAEAKRPRYAWLPFGAGPRTCIGMAFATIEGQLVLASLLRHARFEPLADEVPEVSATLRPLHGMPMRVRLRDKSLSGSTSSTPRARDHQASAPRRSDP
jgi:cytochrome P450